MPNFKHMAGFQSRGNYMLMQYIKNLLCTVRMVYILLLLLKVTAKGSMRLEKW